MSSIKQLEEWMSKRENEHLEFKEAKNSFHFEKVVKYCVALANEGGGKLILGVTDKLPRRVVGSQSFLDLERTKAGIIERLHLRVDAEELLHPGGRVVIFHVPPHFIGVPVEYEGAYWMRAGEDLVPMTQDRLKHILAEAQPDFSAEVCAGATLDDLDPAAVSKFRTLWHRKVISDNVLHLSDEQLLPALTRNQITVLLRELKNDIYFEGSKRKGSWKRKV